MLVHHPLLDPNHLWKLMVMAKHEHLKMTKLLIEMLLQKEMYQNPLSVLDHQLVAVHLHLIDPVQKLIHAAVAVQHHHVQNLVQEAQVPILDPIVIK